VAALLGRELRKRLGMRLFDGFGRGRAEQISIARDRLLVGRAWLSGHGPLYTKPARNRSGLMKVPVCRWSCGG
jgi:hypothetical protein